MRRPKPSLPASLLLTCLALGWLIYQQLAIAPNTEAVARNSVSATPDLPDLPPELHFTMGEREEFDAVLKRPLFSPSRRPAIPEAVASQEFDFILKGVLIDNEAQIALLRRSRDGQMIRLREGEEINRWALKKVELDYVILERGGREVLLEMVFDLQRSVEERLQ